MPFTSEVSVLHLGLSLVLQLVVGIAIGSGARLGMAWVVNHLNLKTQGLYPLAALALVLLTFGLTDALGGNGFLTVYLAGIVLETRSFVYRENIISFHDGLSWLMQIVMFLTLSLLVFPSQVLQIASVGLAIAFFLIFVARPISVFLCLAPTCTSLREKLFISWVGLRGAVPIVLATFPVLARLEGADQLFNVVFFVVLISVTIQGFSLAPVARWLGLATVS